jgi:hypothetical protein
MYSEAITLFNYHKASNSWYPSVIRGVDLIDVRSKRNSATVTSNADTAEILINCEADKSLQTDTGAKSYTTDKEFQRCAEPQNCYTFTEGKDFIYHGVWPTLTPISDNVGVDSGFFQSVNDNYSGVYKINSVAFYGLIPHFEIGGR